MAMPKSVITFLTDFGLTDTYVGEMKGVVMGIAPDTALVDLTHNVPPQAIAEGAFLLGAAYTAFPKGTIHVAVVDPSVGTERRALLLVSTEYCFVGPDNGLFSYVIRDGYRGARTQARKGLARVPPGWQAFHLNDPRYHRPSVSGTFHGRDIFAPAAAHLAAGVPPKEMGEPIEWLVYSQPLVAKREGDTVRGEVAHVDCFGNLVTCIPEGMLPPGTVQVEAGGAIIHGLSRTYQDGPRVLALIGSRGTLEVSIRDGNASKELGVGTGVIVTVKPDARQQRAI
jgi:S-adenosylmethionine hydrolase